jgi:DNA-binding SARP family transcriptional activator
MQAAARAAVDAFLQAFVVAEGRRLRDAYAALCAEVAQAAADRAEAVWRLAAALLPFEPPRVEPPSLPPAPQPAGFQLGSLRLLLDGLQDAAARLLPRGAALRRLAAQARDEAEVRYGQAVEQSRESFRRVYDEHFRTVLSAYEEALAQAARAVESALQAAEERAQAIESGRQASAPLDERRRDELRELLALLRRIEVSDPRSETVPATARGPA